MTTTLLEVVAKKLEQGEAAPTILQSIPPEERRVVVEWAALELAFVTLEASASDRYAEPSWQAEAGVSARRLARLLVALWQDPHTPIPNKEA